MTHKGSLTWTRVRFGDLAHCVNDRVDDPKAAGVARYVGLEHLDAESLSIRRWGSPDDVESTKLRFKSGDIIFGKRRAYQRKIAVADFEGICSAHAMVLRPTPDAVATGFLPFFMQSDLFMERAIAISVGSLSPTINWKTLAEEEFALPPIALQTRLVPALQSVSDAVFAARAVVRESQKLFRSSLDAAFGFPIVPRVAAIRPRAGWVLKRVDELTDSSRPISYGILQPGPPVIDGIRMLRIMDFDAFGRRVQTEILRVSNDVAETSRTTYVRAGDLLVSVMATIGRTFVIPIELSGANVNRALTLLPCANTAMGEYLDAYFQSGFVRRLLDVDKIGSAQARINLSDLKALPVPIPANGDLKSVLATRETVIGMMSAAETRLSRTLELNRALNAATLGE